MKKIIIALVFFISVLTTFTGCRLASHAGHASLDDQATHAGHNSETSQHSSGCH